MVKPFQGQPVTIPFRFLYIDRCKCKFIGESVAVLFLYLLTFELIYIGTVYTGGFFYY